MTMRSFTIRRVTDVSCAVLLVSLVVASARGDSLRHLFLDPAFLQSRENVTLHVNPPQRSELVIRTDKPWEQRMISLFLTVREEDGKLRMWYICRSKENEPNVAYADDLAPNFDPVGTLEEQTISCALYRASP